MTSGEENWRSLAACRDVNDPDIFFPDRSDDVSRDKAIAYCHICPAKNQCLEFARQHDRINGYSLQGIWGGRELKPRHRKKIMKKNHKPIKTIGALAANRKDERIEAATDQADPASADEPGYVGRMRGEYRELADRADKLRDMLQRYADGTLGFEPACSIALLGRQLDVMDEYALILRRRASIEHIDLGERPVTGILRDTRSNKENQ